MYRASLEAIKLVTVNVDIFSKSILKFERNSCFVAFIISKCTLKSTKYSFQSLNINSLPDLVIALKTFVILLWYGFFSSFAVIFS